MQMVPKSHRPGLFSRAFHEITTLRFSSRNAFVEFLYESSPGRFFDSHGSRRGLDLARPFPHVCDTRAPATTRYQVAASSPSRSRYALASHDRLPRVIRPILECLEDRQLLSFSGADLSQVVAVPNLAGSPQFYRATPSGLSPGQVRQAYAVDQI